VKIMATNDAGFISGGLPYPDKKARKKQGKQDKKLQAELEQAREEVQKNERKLAKAQQRLEASKAHLASLEAKLSARPPIQQPPTSDTSPSQQVTTASSPDKEEAWRPDEISSEELQTNQIASAEPGEQVESVNVSRTTPPPDVPQGGTVFPATSGQAETWRPDEISAEESQKQSPL
jgi:hypothetical protein